MGSTFTLEKFKVNSAQVKAYLQTDEGTKAYLVEKANEIMSQANGDYEVQTSIGNDRMKVGVHIMSKETMNDNFDNNTLVKALQSVGS